MGRKTPAFTVTTMPKQDCAACGGFGSIHMTAGFVGGSREFEWPCWECFGTDVRLPLPSPRAIDNA
jgi:DnaJ-class molecular chaperone